MDPEGEEPDAVRAALERALGAHYRVLRLLGRGGMGAVYLAREEALERLVAIKVLRPDLAPTPEGRERFRREARTAAQLTHPNVVPLLAFGEAEDLLYLVMGYVRGEPLSARLRREGRLTPDDVRRVVGDVAEALDYAHRKGVVHRDVKPDNVLVEDETGRAVLTDFGIAKATAGHGMTQTGAIVGTPQYMSPEQASGQTALDGRSDLYSLGLVAYALLTGRPPFDGGSTGDVLVRRLTAEARPVRELAPDTPEDLADAVARCLRRDPSARWPHARALREAVSPTGLGGAQLPEPMDTLDGAVPTAIPLALAGALAALAALADATPGTVPIAVAAVTAAVFALNAPLLFSAVRASRARGFTWAQVVGAACRQPTWWRAFWYPRRFRRPGDLWERLPAPFRAWRLVITLFAAVFLAEGMLHALLPAFAPGGRAFGRAEWLGVPVAAANQAAVHGILALAAVSVALLAAIGVCAVFAARDMRSRGFDTYTLRRLSRILGTAATSDPSAWTDARLAGILLPPRRGAPGEPATPRDLVRAIEEAAARVEGAARAAAEAAAVEARALLASLEDADAEIARLAAGADPTEVGRLRERLAGLGGEGGEAEEMRRLLSQQLALLERMGERLAAARSERARAAEELRARWRSLSAPPAAGPPHTPAADATLTRSA